MPVIEVEKVLRFLVRVDSAPRVFRGALSSSEAICHVGLLST